MGGNSRDRMAALDGLRGVAALAVVLGHTLGALGLVHVPPNPGIGVLVFFVLSGYLIARIVAGHADRPHAYRSFIRRRIVRLGPAIAVFAALGPILLVALRYIDPAEARVDALLILTQTTAISAAAGYPMSNPLLVTWSLTVEWTFYTLFPVIYLTLVRRGHRTLSLAARSAWAAVCLYAVGLLLDSVAFYMLPVANLGLMLLGAALGLAHHTGWTGPERLRLGIWPGGGLLLIALLALAPGNPHAWTYKFPVLPATGIAAALVINGCVAGHPVRRLLASGFLNAVGIRAYSLYLVHVSAIWLAAALTPTWPRWAVAVLSLALVIPMVEFSYRLLEVPVLRTGAAAFAPLSRPVSDLEAAPSTAEPRTSPT